MVTHKFYVSVTNIKYSEKSDALQITSRIFIEDIEALLKERYDLEVHLEEGKKNAIADTYIEKYLRAKLVLELDDKPTPYNYIGKEFDNDILVVYLEIPQVDFDTLKSINIQNQLLTDLYEEQKNLVHMKWKGKKKSFVLTRENNKGMLNL